MGPSFGKGLFETWETELLLLLLNKYLFEDISKRNIPGGEKERGREREKGEQCLWGGEGRGKGRTEGIYIYIYIFCIYRGGLVLRPSTYCTVFHVQYSTAYKRK